MCIRDSHTQSQAGYAPPDDDRADRIRKERQACRAHKEAGVASPKHLIVAKALLEERDERADKK